MSAPLVHPQADPAALQIPDPPETVRCGDCRHFQAGPAPDTTCSFL